MCNTLVLVQLYQFQKLFHSFCLWKSRERMTKNKERRHPEVTTLKRRPQSTLISSHYPNWRRGTKGNIEQHHNLTKAPTTKTEQAESSQQPTSWKQRSFQRSKSMNNALATSRILQRGEKKNKRGEPVFHTDHFTVW